MRTNTRKSGIPSEGLTHEGAPAAKISYEQQLRRSVLANLLYEGTFYEDGVEVGQRIADLCAKVQPEVVSQIAIEARSQMNLRHVPLWLAVQLAKVGGPVVSRTIREIVQRPDEITEMLSLYWKEGKKPLSAQVKKGLALAFQRFNRYELAKYRGDDNSISLRDAMFLTHPKPTSQEQAEAWNDLANNELRSFDTWEQRLSAAGKDQKAQVFTDLIRENKLGSFALIRNLRGMLEAGVDIELIRQALKQMKTERILPFRFISAAKYAPQLDAELDEQMLRCCQRVEKLPGETVLVVDVSGSMYRGSLSVHSEMDRCYVACALAALAREICAEVDIFATAGDDGRRIHATRRVPNRRGLPLVSAIYELSNPLGGGGIFLSQCMDYIWEQRKGKRADRVIVITDEQDCETDPLKSPLRARQIATRQYLINIASDKKGIGYGPWIHLDGISEAILDYIRVSEQGV